MREVGALQLLRVQPPEADLIEFRSLSHADAKAARRDLGVKRPLIGARDAVEDVRAVGDEAGENIEASGRAFRIGERRYAVGKMEMFEEGDDIDATAFEDGAVLDVDRLLVAGDGPQLLHDGAVLARQEARPDAIGAGSKPKIEARRLQLAFLDELLRQNHAPAQHDFDLLTRQQPEMRAEIVLVQIREKQLHGAPRSESRVRRSRRAPPAALQRRAKMLEI